MIFADNIRKSLTYCALTALALLWMNGVSFAQQSEDWKVNETNIRWAIENEMLTDDAVSSHLIDVDVADGIVTLSGSVDNLLAKQRAATIGESIKGVKSVVNDIRVKPIERSDAEVEGDVEAALREDPATDSYEVEAEVQGGVVTLTGSVDSWPERSLSEYVAKNVKGVREIKNNIRVDQKEVRLDSEVAAEIRRRIEVYVWVDETSLSVTVHEGEVNLDGTVASAAEKTQAKTLCWVAGVNSVDASDVKVQWWVDEPMQRKRPAPRSAPLSDSEVKDSIERAFLYDPRVAEFKVDVSVDDGVVRLSGTVDNREAKRAAANDTENTVGVWRVKNHLKVRPKESVSDPVLSDRVREALERNTYTYRPDITVSAANGKVYLNGTVDTSFEKNKAEEVASRMKGVVDVANRLTVDYVWPEKSDWEIVQDIKDELWWSPFVDSDEVSVTVEEKTATLEGTVDTWGEKKAAIDNAYEGGAKTVVNELKVRYGPDYYFPGGAPYHPY